VQFTADQYYRTGRERMRQARLLYKDGESYALTMYTSGLAVECPLRAFRWKKNPSFEGRHDLMKLFKESGLVQINEERLQRKRVPVEQWSTQIKRLRALMNTVVALWINELRFASESHVRSRLVAMHRHEEKKGDVLKANALDLLRAAQGVIDVGVFLWTSKKK
jgi:hypothetical protein